MNTKEELEKYRIRMPERLAALMAQIFPPREEFVNVAENCYHLYELSII